jgi:hypothetical protein
MMGSIEQISTMQSVRDFKVHIPIFGKSYWKRIILVHLAEGSEALRPMMKWWEGLGLCWLEFEGLKHSCQVACADGAASCCRRSL